jgi:drug/metabolite transporter (DMT)-like permease
MAKHIKNLDFFTVPVATFLTAVVCGTDKLKYDVFLNMVLVSVGVVVSSYGEIHFNVLGTTYQVMGMFGEALRLVLTQVLLQKKGLTLNPITSLYYIAPCRYLILTYLEPLNYCSIFEFDMSIQALMVLIWCF